MDDESILLGKTLADGWDLVIEDDGRVAYAYLRHGEQIVSDVWLYNVAPAPAEPEWAERPPDPPYLNPAKFVGRTSPRRLRSDDDFEATWSAKERKATVLVDGQPWAVLQEGSKPGWCAGASREGPLAKPL